MRAIVVRDDRMLVMQRDKFGQVYYTLIGGGIDAGETADQALRREISEESGFALQSARPVFIEEAGDPYGTQYIYLCEVTGDEPKLSPESDEAKLFDLGNKHTPMWIPIKDLPSLTFRTPGLQKALQYGFEYGFPQQSVQLDGAYLDAVAANIVKKGQA